MPAAHRLQLDDSSEVEFDKLLIATGSHPVSPPIPGMDLPGIHACWTLADARNIASKAKPGAKVVLMGAGLSVALFLRLWPKVARISL